MMPPWMGEAALMLPSIRRAATSSARHRTTSILMIGMFGENILVFMSFSSFRFFIANSFAHSLLLKGWQIHRLNMLFVLVICEQSSGEAIVRTN